MNQTTPHLSGLSESQVVLRGLRLFAHHGVLPQERIVGAYFLLDVTIDIDFSQAAEDDDLKGTLSYAEAYEIIFQEMNKPSNLLEHVGMRICRALLSHFPAVRRVQLELLKQNPPMGADCLGAGIRISLDRHA